MRFERGDVVRVRLNPTAGKETQGDDRPCLVLSASKFNRLGTVIVVPITQGGNFARVQGFAVSLMGTGTKTQGVVLANGVRTMDLIARKARKIESVPDYIVDEVLAKVLAILEG